MATGPLRGVRIVEFAGIGPAPFASMMLADMGADIIRIAKPGTGAPGPAEFLQRSRSTVEVDLKDLAQRAKVKRLVCKCDALVEGFRPGVMERNGLGPESLMRDNAKLVYGRMTGWGQTGPLAQAAGHDINYISLSGALAAIGPAERPAVPLNLVGDYGGGALYLVTGILAAIIDARATGRGQVVDAAMCDSVASLMTIFHYLAQTGRWQERRESNLLDGGRPFYTTYTCKDGRFMAAGPLEPQFYEEFLRRLGLLGDPLFDHQNDSAAWPAMRERLEQVFATRTQDEWVAIFEGSDACVTPVLTVSQAHTHPHLAARGSYVVRDGRVQPAPAPRFSRTPSSIQEDKPALTTLDQMLAAW
ncbi:CaiB/BaiF CoA-transferase family protein [Comamonadaceae bacterium G21597-S1]|nr:CaiB/BaiF CoA-transferase family protein [Comamonadaceae bacterium G21597-S1]